MYVLQVSKGLDLSVCLLSPGSLVSTCVPPMHVGVGLHVCGPCVCASLRVCILEHVCMSVCFPMCLCGHLRVCRHVSLCVSVGVPHVHTHVPESWGICLLCPFLIRQVS